MHDHKRCPECDDFDTKVVHTEWFSDMVERTRICNSCPTQYTVSYANPAVRDVEQFE